MSRVASALAGALVVCVSQDHHPQRVRWRERRTGAEESEGERGAAQVATAQGGDHLRDQREGAGHGKSGEAERHEDEHHAWSSWQHAPTRPAAALRHHRHALHCWPPLVVSPCCCPAKLLLHTAVLLE